ncbi:helix-turn-helix domain-containing protein [Catellatospora sp. NEAU-YM18]|nr:helix-turn-helix transcriptional regulator [Catellatospora tritici]MBV1855430.1 helix-turn-helix domain-containing protein [Catellatospora tritici]
MQSPDIGAFIKDLRENARISLRQLAEQANISNPYLSQIERGLRKPSAEVLAQLAAALRVSTPVMYLKAGLLGSDHDGHSVPTAIAADPLLTVAQKQSLTQIYDTFVRENARTDDPAPETTPPAEATAKQPASQQPAPPQEPAPPAAKKAVGKKSGRKKAQEEQ